ncbi:MAG: ChaN family lipoprotein [Pseudomonadota bacterium]
MGKTALMGMIAVVWAMLGAVSAQAQMQPQMQVEWQSKVNGDNPLVGRIYNAKGVEVPLVSLLRRAALTRYVLIGEQHDNPDHHVIQGQLLEQLAKIRPNMPVVLEMVPERLGEQLNLFDLNSDQQLDAYAKRLEWEERGWYTFDIYRPMVMAAIKNSLPLFPGNLDRTMTRALSKQGADALPAARRTAYGLDQDLDAAQTERWNTVLANSHCGMMPASAIPAMLTVQRARDGYMASQLIETGKRAGSALIAGNGHVRRDRGVPFVLSQLKPGIEERAVAKTADGRDIIMRVPVAHSMAIGIIEVGDGKTWADYDLGAQDGAEPVYDYTIFTPVFDDTDQCEAMRAAMEKMKNQKKTNP